MKKFKIDKLRSFESYHRLGIGLKLKDNCLKIFPQYIIILITNHVSFHLVKTDPPFIRNIELLLKLLLYLKHIIEKELS